MAVCAAAHCHNTSRKGFVMVRFPKDDDLRERWLLSLRRPGWEPNENTRLCEAHFELNQWTKVRCRLKDDAVPTQFCTCSKEDACDHKDRFSSQADHTYSKQVLKSASCNYVKHEPDDQTSLTVKIDPSLCQVYEDVPLKRCWHRKKKCSRDCQCNISHSNSCIFFNNKSNYIMGGLYSSKREQIFYEVLEENVALKSELARLTKLFNRTVKHDS